MRTLRNVRNPVKQGTPGVSKSLKGERFLALLSGRPWVRIPPGAPKPPKNPRFRAKELLTALRSGIGGFSIFGASGVGAPAHFFKEPLADF